MLLGFLGLYLAMQPHTFSLPGIIQAHPLAHAPTTAAFVFFALLLGFGVKLPTVPLHNWLPDAHVEAPTEGSVILAGLQLKMGGYGLVAVLLPALPQTARHFGWCLVSLALVSMVYGALAALAQTDMKRLVAYTSINHMGYVTLAVAIAAMSTRADVRSLALNGAVVQMVSHGLLTGGLFLMVGMLQHRTGTRELDRFGGLLGQLPAYSGLFAALAFGSFGLPGLSGFIAEFQVIGASLTISIWVAAAVALGLLIMTGVYLRLAGVLMGHPPQNMPPLAPFGVRELGLAAVLTAVSLLIGILPVTLVAVVSGATRLLARF
jgi:NADH-quinone oxidoreductase subunit M